jgi:hypothetical protein
MTMRDAAGGEGPSGGRAAGGRNPKTLGAVCRPGDCRSALRQPFRVVLMALALVRAGVWSFGRCP